MTDSIAFDLADPLPRGRTVLEASAGTGKTYSITALVARYIAEDDVPVDQILVVTFTRAAANELRERTREVLTIAADALDSQIVPEGHQWLAPMLGGDDLFAADTRRFRRQRLLTAINRFDDLTITTIHGFCQATLTQLGLRSGTDLAAVLVDNTTELVAEVCRDALLGELADDPLRLSA
ncbi:MAG TPA: UvrD-helicase domain-containing protein, partial [Ilumatobacteraceae bacterium]